MLSVRLTRFELEIMEELWKLGRGSVREVLEVLGAPRRPAYTTVQTIVRRLEEKGAVRRIKKVGNAHVYEPTVSRKAAYHRLVDDFLAVFGGSARPLVAHLAESGKLNLDDVKALEEILNPGGEGQGGEG